MQKSRKIRRTPLPKKHYSFDLPCRIIFFKYKNVPAELHAICLESGSFGVGSNFDETVHSLAQSVMAQVSLDVKTSTFIHATDAEWEQAWAENRISSIEGAEIVAKGAAKLSVEITRDPPKVVLNDRIQLLNPALRETQHA